MTVPEPPQRWQGWEMENSPWPWDSTPRPWQRGQTFGLVPGFAPVPEHVPQRSVVGTDDRHLRALDGLREGDLRLDLEIAALLRARAPREPRPAAAGRAAAAAVEEVREDVAEPARVEAAEAAAAGGAPGRPEAAPVVGLALLGIREQVVGLLDLLEALLGLLVVRVAVGVVLADQLAVGLLDLVGRRRPLDSQDLVGIALLGHCAPS